MNFFKFTLLGVGIISILFLNSGCIRTYAPIYFGNSASPMVFNHKGQDSSSRFLGGEVTISEGFNGDEKLILGKLTHSYVSTRKHSNLNVNVFAAIGNYEVKNLYSYNYLADGTYGIEKDWNGNKPNFVLGGETRLALNFAPGDFRIGAGTTLGMVYEFGTYSKFRNDATSKGVIGKDVNNLLLLFNVFGVLQFQASNSTNISLQTCLGAPGFITQSFLINTKGYLYWVGINPYGITGGVQMEIPKILF